MRMVVVVIMTFMTVVVMIIVVVMIMVIVIVMIIVVVMIMVIVIVMIVMIIVVVMIVMSMRVNDAVEVFRFSVNGRRTNGTFNGEDTVVRQAPFENVPELSIDGVVLRFAIEIGLETTVPLDRDHRSDTEFTGWNLFTTTVSTVGMNSADCSIACQQQAQSRSSIQERKTRKNHWIKRFEKYAEESAN